jgi:hypothetical protein
VAPGAPSGRAGAELLSRVGLGIAALAGACGIEATTPADGDPSLQ